MCNLEAQAIATANAKMGFWCGVIITSFDWWVF